MEQAGAGGQMASAARRGPPMGLATTASAGWQRRGGRDAGGAAGSRGVRPGWMACGRSGASAREARRTAVAGGCVARDLGGTPACGGIRAGAGR